METTDISRPKRDPLQTVSVKREVLWAVLFFVLLVAVRVVSVPLSGWLGLDESQEYLVTKPMVFVSNWALLVAGWVCFIKFVFPNTLGHDMGTRFNDAWNKIEDPKALIWIYIGIGGPLVLAMALLLGMN
jgi:hypothetical protein